MLIHEVAPGPATLPGIVKKVGGIADSLGIEAYVVGGFVRDLLLNRPSKDIDFVCVGNGARLAEEVDKALNSKSKLSIYKNFGTASISCGAYDLEFVGARKESYRSESRKPIVENGTLEDDQNRRDFTINALAIGINADKFGELIDPFGGVKHLGQGIIKTPRSPETTFSDDPLRIMRAIRFAAQLQFDIDPDTFEAIMEQKERIKIVSQERVTDELNKIILSKTPSYGFKLLFACGLIEIIFPKMQKLHGVKEINGKAHKDNFYHTLQVLDNISKETEDLWLRWAAILHDIAKPATQRFNDKAGWTFHGHEDLGAKWVPQIFRNLKLPLNDKMKYVQKLVKLHLRPIALVNEEVTESAIRRLLYEAGDEVDDLLKLCRADITSKNPDKVKRYLANFKKVEDKFKKVEERDHLRSFQPPISGEQIMDAFGLKPSRAVGEIKSAIKEAILNGKIKNNRQEAYELMILLGKSHGLTAKSE